MDNKITWQVHKYNDGVDHVLMQGAREIGALSFNTQTKVATVQSTPYDLKQVIPNCLPNDRNVEQGKRFLVHHIWIVSKQRQHRLNKFINDLENLNHE